MRWLGHAAFYVVSPSGVRVLTDPFAASVPYPPISVECDAVTVSHEHSDHNGVQVAKGSPKVIRGLRNKGVAHLKETIGDVTFRTVASFHDAEEGSKRGANAIFVMDFGGLKVVHLGDLGHELKRETVEEIGRCHVLLVPVGGYYTMDGKTAAKVVRSLAPRVTIPMHFRTRYIAEWPISGPEEFLGEWTRVKKLDPGEFPLGMSNLPGEDEIWLPAI